MIMATPIVLSPSVISTIQSLPLNERLTIAAAIAGEMILGRDVRHDLTPFENILYTMISDSVERDSARFKHKFLA
jgi:hypothetical protein